MKLRLAMFMGAFVMGIIWITMLTLLIQKVPEAAASQLGANSFAGDLRLDRNTTSFVYPFTIQNLMWIVFFVGAGELLVRLIASNGDASQLGKRLLPEDDQTVLRKQDVGKIYREIRATDPANEFWLQRLLSRSILAFQSTGSVEQVSSIFNSTMELCQHEVDLRYNMIRYLVWLIPTLGFIGTVVGIALALRSAGITFAGVGPDADLTELGPQLMQGLTKDLGVAFYTTLLALLQSAVLMFAMHLIQGQEEGALNRVGQYCLDNLINRLYEAK